MLQQDLFNFTRINIHATTDNEIFGTITQREEPIFIKTPHIASVQPTSAKSFCTRLGLIPIIRHHNVSANDDFANFSHWNFLVILIDDTDLHICTRKPNTLHLLPPTRVCSIGMILFRQTRDRHRSFTLTINLGKTWTKDSEGFLEVGKIHRSATINDCLQVR